MKLILCVILVLIAFASARAHSSLRVFNSLLKTGNKKLLKKSKDSKKEIQKQAVHENINKNCANKFEKSEMSKKQLKKKSYQKYFIALPIDLSQVLSCFSGAALILATAITTFNKHLNSDAVWKIRQLFVVYFISLQFLIWQVKNSIEKKNNVEKVIEVISLEGININQTIKEYDMVLVDKMKSSSMMESAMAFFMSFFQNSPNPIIFSAILGIGNFLSNQLVHVHLFSLSEDLISLQRPFIHPVARYFENQMKDSLKSVELKNKNENNNKENENKENENKENENKENENKENENNEKDDEIIDDQNIKEDENNNEAEINEIEINDEEDVDEEEIDKALNDLVGDDDEDDEFIDE